MVDTWPYLLIIAILIVGHFVTLRMTKTQYEHGCPILSVAWCDRPETCGLVDGLNRHQRDRVHRECWKRYWRWQKEHPSEP